MTKTGEPKQSDILLLGLFFCLWLYEREHELNAISRE